MPETENNRLNAVDFWIEQQSTIDMIYYLENKEQIEADLEGGAFEEDFINES